MNRDELDDSPLGCRRDPRQERTPSAIETQVLNVHNGSSVDELAEALCASDWLLSRAKAIDTLLKQVAIHWIEENGPFTLGDIEHTVGYHSSNKCLDVLRTGHRVLEAVEGDVDQLLSALCSQPFKAASVRSILQPRQFGLLFKYVRTGKLVNGVPERVLKRVDRRFIETKARDE